MISQQDFEEYRNGDDWDEDSDSEENGTMSDGSGTFGRPNPWTIRDNIRMSHAAFLGFSVTLIAIIGMILCYSLPWITYEGERQEYDPETDETTTVDDSVSIGYGEFDDRGNMDRLRWPTDRSSDHYEEAASASMGGFRFMLILGILTYLVAVYQHSGSFSGLISRIPGTLTDPQKRILILHLLSGLFVFQSTMTLKSVFRFLQLQIAYNHNSDLFGTGQVIFAGWAGIGIIITAGSILIIGLHMILTIIRSGCASPRDGWNDGDQVESMATEEWEQETEYGPIPSKQRIWETDSGRYSMLSMGIIIISILGLAISLLIPSLSLTTNWLSGGQEEQEILVDDANVNEFSQFPWYIYDIDGSRSSGVNRELEDWQSSSEFNVNAFRILLLFGLLCTIGVTFNEFGKVQYFTLAFWGAIGLTSLLSIAVMISNILWIRGAGDLGDELYNTLAWISTFSFETAMRNPVPLVISVLGSVTLPAFLFLHRHEVMSGLSDTDDRIPADTTWPILTFPLTGRDGSSPLSQRGLTISLAVFLLLAVSVGAYARETSLGGDSGDLPERPWTPQKKYGDREDEYLDEYSSMEFSYWHGISTIYSINFTLRWADEADETLAENYPDEFRLTVESPWNETKQSDWVANEHGEEGVIELSFLIEGDPGDTGSLGHFNVTVECGECGDQWYTNPPTVGLADNGNNFLLTHDYWVWKQL